MTALASSPSPALPLVDQLIDLINRAETISPLWPVTAYFKLRTLSSKQRAIQPLVDAAIQQHQGAVGGPISAPGFAIGAVAAQQGAQNVAAILRIHKLWQELGAVLDRKYAYALAVLSLYVALVALLATVLFGLFTISQ